MIKSNDNENGYYCQFNVIAVPMRPRIAFCTMAIPRLNGQHFLLYGLLLSVGNGNVVMSFCCRYTMRGMASVYSSVIFMLIYDTESSKRSHIQQQQPHCFTVKPPQRKKPTQTNTNIPIITTRYKCIVYTNQTDPNNNHNSM